MPDLETILTKLKAVLTDGSTAGRIVPALKAVYQHDGAVTAYPSAVIWLGREGSTDASGILCSGTLAIKVYIQTGDAELIRSTIRGCCRTIRQEIRRARGCGADTFTYRSTTYFPGWNFSNPALPVPVTRADMVFDVKFKEDYV